MIKKIFQLKIRSRILLFILSISLLVSTIGCNRLGLEVTPKGDRLFTNNIGGYSIQYPNGWTALELPYGQGSDDDATGLIFKNNPGYPIVDIAQKVTTSPSIDQAITWGELRISASYDDQDEVDNYDLGEPVFIEHDSYQMAQRTYIITFNDSDYEPLKKLDTYIIAGDEIFILTFSSPLSSFDNQIEIFNEMIESFRIAG